MIVSGEKIMEALLVFIIVFNSVKLTWWLIEHLSGTL